MLSLEFFGASEEKPSKAPRGCNKLPIALVILFYIQPFVDVAARHTVALVAGQGT